MYRKIMIQIYLLEDVCKKLYVKVVFRHYNFSEKITDLLLVNRLRICLCVNRRCEPSDQGWTCGIYSLLLRVIGPARLSCSARCSVTGSVLKSYRVWYSMSPVPFVSVLSCMEAEQVETERWAIRRTLSSSTTIVDFRRGPLEVSLFFSPSFHSWFSCLM